MDGLQINHSLCKTWLLIPGKDVASIVLRGMQFVMEIFTVKISFEFFMDIEKQSRAISITLNEFLISIIKYSNDMQNCLSSPTSNQ